MNLEKLYKLPWNNKDNPNWWIEPTTYCQLKCPWCYRWLDTDSIKFTHLDLEVLKKQVIDFDEKRNVQTISIAWWEPLMYPQIEELIKFISNRKLFTKIFTNWILLKEKMLLKLKKAWATEFIIHIDMFQNLPQYKWKNEIELNELRQQYVDLFKKVWWVNLGFIMPMSKNNIEYLPEIMNFYRKNIETINLIVFTVFKDVHDNNKAWFDTEFLSKEISKYTNYLPSSYLPKVLNNNLPSWLFSMWFGNNDNYFWDVDSSIYKKLMESYHRKWWKYFITRKRKQIKLMSLFLLIFNSSWRNILKNIIKSKNRNIFYQVILIIEPPEKTWDWCDWCPDLMYIWDKLYPSCMINEYKAFKDKFLKK